VTGTGKPAERGRFITIEGPEGSGKTTQAERLAARLRADGHDVLVTREPGGTRLGEQLRAILLARHSGVEPTDPLTDALLFEAARRQLVRHVVRPSLDSGTTVVCARYADSTLAYQGFGAGVPLDTLRALDHAATDGLTPDLTILLDLPVEVGLARKGPADMTRFEADHDLAFHRGVREGFRRLAEASPQRFVTIDATLPEAEVTGAIVEAVASRLHERSNEPSTADLRTHR
jgi:dTMP kinase